MSEIQKIPFKLLSQQATKIINKNFDDVDEMISLLNETIARLDSGIPNQVSFNNDIGYLDVSKKFTVKDGGSFSASGLPTGLTIDADTGLITGDISLVISENTAFVSIVTYTPLNEPPQDKAFTWTVSSVDAEIGVCCFQPEDDPLDQWECDSFLSKKECDIRKNSTFYGGGNPLSCLGLAVGPCANLGACCVTSLDGTSSICIDGISKADCDLEVGSVKEWYPGVECANLTKGNCVLTGGCCAYNSDNELIECFNNVTQDQCEINIPRDNVGISFGVWQSTNCTDSPCPEKLGACCLPDFSCVLAGEEECEMGLNGVYQGDNTKCSDINCVPPVATGVCCLPEGSPQTCITGVTQAECEGDIGGYYGGDNKTCADVDCLYVCCELNGNYARVTNAQCTAAGGTVVADNLCPDLPDLP